MEWSILCGDPTGVTVFFIDGGIDTGSPIIHWESLTVQHERTVAEAKAYPFSKDAELYRTAVDKIESGAASEPNDVVEGLRFYEMSLLLRSVVQEHFELSNMS